MSISAKDVKALRDATGVGMMDCKKALQETDGDFDAAVELLRKKGQKVAAKRAEKEADEGLISIAISEDGSAGAIVEVNCETDFVARNEDFESFVDRIADLTLTEKPSDLDALHSLSYNGEATVKEELVAMTGRIGEKLDIRRFRVVESQEGEIIKYVHPGSKLGVIVEVSGNGDREEAGRDVAMQIAALDPIAVDRSEVPEEVQEKEKEIARDAAINEGKPEHILDRIVEGKLERFFEDHVLLEQSFVKDASQSVQEMLDDADVKVHRFVRFALGD
ncbi:elongation factor Ts [Longibacter salinarum]|uniref:Elongation factor Ts n=1 Tax=Longibacter salinarum TaxID=1850348 RepID=A0A2A8CUW1_9BACT|nr:translation elongation factor Ts [Longibacter salinarum]PEN12549.1 elongation factor Ts [Longibacter salinarum]